MKRFVCWLTGHQWKRTGIARRQETAIGVVLWQAEHECLRCESRMWE